MGSVSESLLELELVKKLDMALVEVPNSACGRVIEMSISDKWLTNRRVECVSATLVSTDRAINRDDLHFYKYRKKALSYQQKRRH